MFNQRTDPLYARLRAMIQAVSWGRYAESSGR